ncbi:hypothetical protein LTR78_004907 [Recurvomyces mirabilis]|uniref:Uncharacterized protein n=1 Tax=Recurvomyces mirabilis TaxID=574656 RepID=A0AAE0WPC0_9PEZI|nr:hypothetical protein LTR78_004907 [Recurvomyces mirabilis]KAK5158077.1 hypothetical protein LTS14_004000 [Recurvomyces mirabilis]
MVAIGPFCLALQILGFFGLSYPSPLVSNSSQLSRRINSLVPTNKRPQADPYKVAEQEGAALSAQFSLGPQNIGQSYFTNYGALRRHGWTQRTNVAIEENQLPEPARVILGHPLDRSDTPTPPGSPAGTNTGNVEQFQWRRILWSRRQHSQPAAASGGGSVMTPIYGATGATYDVFYSMNSTYGAIIDGTHVTPQQAHPQKTEENTFDFNPDEAPMVPLSEWHDVMALSWQHVCEKNNQNPTKLKYVLRVNLQDKESMEVFIELLPFFEDDTQDDVVIFKAGTRQFNAMLGSSTGVDVAHLLLQHKVLFGQRRVTKIGLWRDHKQEVKTVNILFCFDDCAVLPDELVSSPSSPRVDRFSQIWEAITRKGKGKSRGKGKERQW